MQTKEKALRVISNGTSHKTFPLKVSYLQIRAKINSPFTPPHEADALKKLIDRAEKATRLQGAELTEIDFEQQENGSIHPFGEKQKFSFKWAEMQQAPYHIMERVQDPSKCVWFRFDTKGKTNARILGEEVKAKHPADMPTHKPLVVVKLHNGEFQPIAGIKCVFIDNAVGYGYQFKNMLHEERNVFFKFSNIVQVFLIRAWLSDEGEFNQHLIVKD